MDRDAAVYAVKRQLEDARRDNEQLKEDFVELKLQRAAALAQVHELASAERLAHIREATRAVAAARFASEGGEGWDAQDAHSGRSGDTSVDESTTRAVDRVTARNLHLVYGYTGPQGADGDGEGDAGGVVSSSDGPAGSGYVRQAALAAAQLSVIEAARAEDIGRLVAATDSVASAVELLGQGASAVAGAKEDAVRMKRWIAMQAGVIRHLLRALKRMQERQQQRDNKAPQPSNPTAGTGSAEGEDSGDTHSADETISAVASEVMVLTERVLELEGGLRDATASAAREAWRADHAERRLAELSRRRAQELEAQMREGDGADGDASGGEAQWPAEGDGDDGADRGPDMLASLDEETVATTHAAGGRAAVPQSAPAGARRAGKHSRRGSAPPSASQLNTASLGTAHTAADTQTSQTSIVKGQRRMMPSYLGHARAVVKRPGAVPAAYKRAASSGYGQGSVSAGVAEDMTLLIGRLREENDKLHADVEDAHREALELRVLLASTTDTNTEADTDEDGEAGADVGVGGGDHGGDGGAMAAHADTGVDASQEGDATDAVDESGANASGDGGGDAGAGGRKGAGAGASAALVDIPTRIARLTEAVTAERKVVIDAATAATHAVAAVAKGLGTLAQVVGDADDGGASRRAMTAARNALDKDTRGIGEWAESLAFELLGADAFEEAFADATAVAVAAAGAGDYGGGGGGASSGDGGVEDARGRKHGHRRWSQGAGAEPSFRVPRGGAPASSAGAGAGPGAGAGVGGDDDADGGGEAARISLSFAPLRAKRRSGGRSSSGGGIAMPHASTPDASADTAGDEDSDGIDDGGEPDERAMLGQTGTLLPGPRYAHTPAEASSTTGKGHSHTLDRHESFGGAGHWEGTVTGKHSGVASGSVSVEADGGSDVKAMAAAAQMHLAESPQQPGSNAKTPLGQAPAPAAAGSARSSAASSAGLSGPGTAARGRASSSSGARRRARSAKGGPQARLVLTSGIRDLRIFHGNARVTVATRHGLEQFKGVVSVWRCLGAASRWGESLVVRAVVPAVNSALERHGWEGPAPTLGASVGLHAFTKGRPELLADSATLKLLRALASALLVDPSFLAAHGMQADVPATATHNRIVLKPVDASLAKGAVARLVGGSTDAPPDAADDDAEAGLTRPVVRDVDRAWGLVDRLRGSVGLQVGGSHMLVTVRPLLPTADSATEWAAAVSAAAEAATASSAADAKLASTFGGAVRDRDATSSAAAHSRRASGGSTGSGPRVSPLPSWESAPALEVAGLAVAARKKYRLVLSLEAAVRLLGPVGLTARRHSAGSSGSGTGSGSDSGGEFAASRGDPFLDTDGAGEGERAGSGGDVDGADAAMQAQRRHKQRMRAAAELLAPVAAISRSADAAEAMSRDATASGGSQAATPSAVLGDKWEVDSDDGGESAAATTAAAAEFVVDAGAAGAAAEGRSGGGGGRGTTGPLGSFSAVAVGRQFERALVLVVWRPGAQGGAAAVGDVDLDAWDFTAGARLPSLWVPRGQLEEAASTVELVAAAMGGDDGSGGGGGGGGEPRAETALLALPMALADGRAGRPRHLSLRV